MVKEKEGAKMTEIQILRRKLLLMGFCLFEVGGGFLIRSMYYDSLKAGTEAQPLSLSEVARFAA